MWALFVPTYEVAGVNQQLHRGSDSDTCCQCAIVFISNLHHRKLEFDSESLGLLALHSVLRVGV